MWKEEAVGEGTDESIEFPEPPEGLLTAPVNRVMALLSGPDEVAAAVEELVQAGFDRDEIFVLCGPKGAERLDVSGRHHGLHGRVYRFVERIGDEREMLLRSRDHLAAGGFVLTVPADDSDKTTAAHVLSQHGAHGMVHFGKLHWEPLGT
jgi:hypothetical protein